MNPNDEIRREILQYFYNRNKNATSRMGKRGSAIKISDVKRELKALCKITQQQVMCNLTYLIDNGWIKTVAIEKTVAVRGGTIPQVTTYYEITAKGIDKIEGGSQFEPKERYAGIKINATGQNIITLGDGNIVNVKYSRLHDALNELKKAISESVDLEEKDKLNLVVDVESIKDQLAKDEPDKTVIGKLWEGIQKISTVASLAAFIMQITPLIQSIIC